MSGTTTTYVYDVAGSLPMLLDDGVRKYVWGPSGLAYSVDKTSGAVQVYHADGLGSVRAITDSTGSVVQTYQTDEFGVPVQTPGTSTQTFGFTGEQRDSEDGFVYLRARMYDPSIGRFLQRDMWAGYAGAPLTLNRFTYALNSPVVFVDPSGFASNKALQDNGPGRCAPPFLPTALRMLIDETFCPVPQQRSKDELQLDYRPELQCGGLPTVGFGGCILASRGEAKKRVPPPERDETGKVHTPLPGSVPDDWTREDLEGAVAELQGSIARRQAEQVLLGEEGRHRTQIGRELTLLRQILKKLSGS